MPFPEDKCLVWQKICFGTCSSLRDKCVKAKRTWTNKQMAFQLCKDKCTAQSVHNWFVNFSKDIFHCCVGCVKQKDLMHTHTQTQTHTPDAHTHLHANTCMLEVHTHFKFFLSFNVNFCFVNRSCLSWCIKENLYGSL